MTSISITPDFQEIIDLLQNLPDAKTMPLRRESVSSGNKSKVKFSNVKYCHSDSKDVYNVLRDSKLGLSYDDLYNSSKLDKQRGTKINTICNPNSDIDSTNLLTNILKRSTHSNMDDRKGHSSSNTLPMKGSCNTLPLQKKSPTDVHSSSTSNFPTVPGMMTSTAQLMSTSCSAISVPTSQANVHFLSHPHPHSHYPHQHSHKTSRVPKSVYSTASLTRRTKNPPKSTSTDHNNDNQLSTVC